MKKRCLSSCSVSGVFDKKTSLLYFFSVIDIVKAEFIKSAAVPADYPSGGLPEFAFFGRSNAGKSSLINMITGRKSLVKTGSTPGMTRLVNFFRINDAFVLTDLPGYGFARRSAAETAAFDKMLADYASFRPQLRAVFFLMDSRRPPAQVEKDSVEYFSARGIDVVLVATKSDKLNNSMRASAKNSLSGFFGLLTGKIIFSSALKKTGRAELLAEIESRL